MYKASCHTGGNTNKKINVTKEKLCKIQFLNSGGLRSRI